MNRDQFYTDNAVSEELIPIEVKGLKEGYFCTEMTMGDSKSINTLSSRFNHDTDSFVPGTAQDVIIATIVQKVVDSKGDKIFQKSDRDQLLRKVSSSLLQKIYMFITDVGQSDKEIEKN